MGELPPELIEKLRQTGIRLDAQGRFWHEGEEIQHERFRSALLRWLDTLPDGRPILRLDDKRYAYVDADDALYLATSAQWEDDKLFLVLNSGERSEPDYESFVQQPDNSLHCLAGERRLPTRITTQAQFIVAERIEERDAGYVLRANGESFAIDAEATTA